MTTTAPLILHPGSACCDPSQDLARWVADQTRQLDVMDRWARVYSKRGQRLRREAIRAQVRGDRLSMRDLDAQSYLYCRTANSIWTFAVARRGDVERITDAHQHLLTGSAA